jgi:hypothetical protein
MAWFAPSLETQQNDIAARLIERGIQLGAVDPERVEVRVIVGRGGASDRRI